MCRHNNQLAADTSDAHRPRRMQKRNLRHVQGRATADHAQYIRLVVLVSRQHNDLDLNFIEIVSGEQRPDRAVAKAVSQNLLRTGPAFALDEATWKLTGRIGFLSIING